MRRTVTSTLEAILAAVLALTACSGQPTLGPAAGEPITVGVLADLTGPNASVFATTEAGVKARFALENAAGGVSGHKLEYVVADTTSTPPGVLSAAQSLVRGKNVFGVLGGSAQLYAAADFLRQQKVPVLATGISAPQFGDPSFGNMFAVTGSSSPRFAVVDTFGRFFKSQGVTKVGGLGYAQSAASTNAVKSWTEGAKAVGLEVSYLNTSLPLGTTDVGSIALQIKDSGVDGLVMPLVTSTGFAILAALKQLGVHLKSTVLTAGYGGDLLTSPPAVQAAQGIEFVAYAAPVELNTPATQTMRKALEAYAGVTTDPTNAQYWGWIAADAFIRGLKAAGPNATPASFTTALRQVHDYAAGGLFTEARVDFSQIGVLGPGMGPGNCLYILRVTGQAFEPIPGATPACGQLTGQNVLN